MKNALSSFLKPECIEDVPPSFAGEDFCEFSERVPSCYIGIGCAEEGSFDETEQVSILV